MNPQLQPQRYSPYRGLIPFSENDSEFFFGREKETRLIVANLFSSPLTLLYGPSGVGKSSVLRAGVINQLRQRPDLVTLIHSEWKDDPLPNLSALVGSLPGVGGNINPNVELGELLRLCSLRLKKRVMVVLDQFEEYFLYHPRFDAFADQLSKAVMQTNAPLSFLIAMREDALAKLDRFEGRIPILFDNYLRLEHLDPAAARSAIEKPIERYNQKFSLGTQSIMIEPGLVAEVVRQLQTGQVSLGKAGLGVIEPGTAKTIETPYLQLIMTRLWQTEIQAQSRVLRLSTLTRLGGAETIVRTHLDAVLKRLTGPQRYVASRIFQYLVTPSGTKIALKASDLAKYAEYPLSDVQILLQRLTAPDIRLLRGVETSGTHELSYEIFHDVLATPILNWRARQIRSTRFRWIWIAAGIMVFLGLYILLTLVLSSAPTDPAADALTYVTRCILGVVAMASCLIPIGIGFLIGRGWARAQ